MPLTIIFSTAMPRNPDTETQINCQPNDPLTVVWEHSVATYGAGSFLVVPVLGIRIPTDDFPFNMQRLVNWVNEGRARRRNADREEVVECVLEVRRRSPLLWNGGANDDIRELPASAVVRSQTPGNPFYYCTGDLARRSNARCPTYGNCPTCLSSGPHGSFCETCRNNGMIGDDSNISLFQFKVYFEPVIRLNRRVIDAEQIAASVPGANHHPVSPSRREHWTRTPIAERNFTPNELSRTNANFRQRYREHQHDD